MRFSIEFKALNYLIRSERPMPVSGGAPRVVAYRYGGQGTISVPSWSPDGRHGALVSNSGK